MSLYNNFFPNMEGEEKLRIHAFVAMLAEYARGEKTKQNIIDTFSLDTAAQTDLTVFTDDIDDLDTDGSKMLYIREVRDVLYLAETGTAYNDQTSFETRLGL